MFKNKKFKKGIEGWRKAVSQATGGCIPSKQGSKPRKKTPDPENRSCK